MYTVLYVDDEPALLELGTVFLELSGALRIETALSAADAIKKLKNEKYDGIISDYQMPVMDGIAFLKYIRKHHGQLPFILFTGRGREEVVIEALNSGADFYLQKGGDPKSQFVELEYKIRLAIERRQTADELRESRQRMTDIIDHLPDATFATDLNGTVIAWNRAMEEMTGVNKEKILGTGDHSYSVPFYGTKRPTLIDIVLKKDTETERKYSQIIRKDTKLISEISIPLLYGGKGAYLWFIASPLYDTHGNIVGAIESIRDITDRKNAEEALRESEERYRAVVEDQTEFITRFRPDGTHVFVNEAYCRYFGKTPGDIIGTRFVPQVFGGDKQRVKQHLQKLTRQNPVATMEHRIIMPDGKIRWQQWSDRAIFDECGNLKEYQSVGRDITDRVKAEDELRSAYEKITASEEELRQQYDELHRSDEALRTSEGIYRTILNNTGSATIIIEEDTTISFVNPEFERIMGYSKEEVEGKIYWTELVVPDDADQMNRYHIMRRTDPVKAPRNYEFRFITKGRQVRSAYLTIGLIPVTKKTVASFVDITEKKQAEEALRESERNYRDILENIQDVYYRSDQEGNLIMISPSGVNLMGYGSENQILGRNIAGTVYADPSERRTFLQALEKDGFVNNFEVDLKRPDGTSVAVETSSHKYYNENGNFLGVEGIFRDISGRKRAEGALARSEVTYRTIFENTGTATVLIEENTTISLANAEFERLSGYSRKEIEGKRSWTEFVAKEDLDQMLDQHRLRRVRQESALRHYEFRFITKSGTIRKIFLTIDLIPGTKRSVASLMDITGRNREQ